MMLRGSRRKMVFSHHPSDLLQHESRCRSDAAAAADSVVFSIFFVKHCFILIFCLQ